MPWLVGMTYKAVRTDRYKYIHWVNRGRAGELDELYDLDKDPFELKNLNRRARMPGCARSCGASWGGSWPAPWGSRHGRRGRRPRVMSYRR